MTLERKKNFHLHSYILMVHNMHNKGGGRRFGMGVQNHRGSEGRKSPSGVQGPVTRGNFKSCIL